MLKNLHTSEICRTFAIATKIMVVHSVGRTTDAQLISRAFFMPSKQS